ncbi:MAG: hypothetical protein KBA71_14575 [Opitutaceae bacterium]|nr:hypothetical protein [Opitutaceae bacterium]
MADHSEIRKVSLEEVLRLKRLERPDPQFWDRFDKELREKQLAAIMAKRPWWQMDLSRMMTGLARARVPVGAAAVLTLTFLVVRENRRPGEDDQGPATSKEMVVTTPASLGDHDSDAIEVAAAKTMQSSAVQVESQPAKALAANSSLSVSAHSAEAAYAVKGDEQIVSPGAGALSPWVGTSIDDSGSRLASGGAAAFAPTLLDLRESGLEAVSQPRSRGMQLAALVSESPANEEPLAKLAGPANSQRARLASYVAAAFKTDGERSSAAEQKARERAISRLSNDELYSSVSRIGLAAGGGLRLTF